MLITRLRDFAMETHADAETKAAPSCPNVECGDLVIECIGFGCKCSTCGMVLECVECGSPVTAAGMRVCDPCSVLEEIE